MTRKVLTIGRSGQMGRALQALPSDDDLIYEAMGRPEVDLASPQTISRAIDRHRPAIVVNAAAWTAVDRAEDEVDAVNTINALAPAVLAEQCRKAGIPLIHLSTDYVFDGSASQPYSVDDPVNPRTVYGSTKAAGETGVRSNVREHLIFRLAWLFSETGHCFPNTILKLAKERDEISVVDDQTGSPTYAGDAASGLHKIIKLTLSGREEWGTYHLTNAGSATWCGFARAVLGEAARFGHPRPTVNPILSKDYPTKAARPAYSVLDNSLSETRFGIRMPHWRDAISRCIRSKFDGNPGNGAALP